MPRLAEPKIVSDSGLSSVAQRWRRSLAERLGAYPSLYFPLYRLAGGAMRLPVCRDTAIVIEGFPRSANTFALLAFRHAQPHPLHVAHHLHSPAQILRGARSGIPVLLVVRDPLAATTSYVIRERCFSHRDALRSYVRFHRDVDAVADSIVVATFDQVTTDFGSVVRAINRRYATSFEEFVHTEENVQACFEQMRRWQLNHTSGEEERCRKVTHPTPQRDSLKRDVEVRLRNDRHCVSLLKDASAIYRRFSERAVLQSSVAFGHP